MLALLTVSLAATDCSAQPVAMPPGPASGLVAVGLEEYEALSALVRGPCWRAETARYRLDATGATARVTAVIEGELRWGGAQEIPLPGGAAVLGEVLLDGKPATVLPATTGLASVICDSPGRHVLQAELTVPIHSRPSGGALSLRVPLVPAARAQVLLPAGAPELSCPDGLVRKPPEAGGAAELRLFPTGTLTLLWGYRREPTATAGQATARADVLVSLASGAARYKVVVSPGGRGTATPETCAVLPPDAIVQAVRMTDGGRQLSHRVSDSPAGLVLTVTLEDRTGQAPAGWTAEFTTRLPLRGGRVRLAVPALRDASAQRGMLVISRPASGRLTVRAAPGLTACDPTDAPELVKQTSLEDLEAVFRYAGLPAAVEAEWQPALPPPRPGPTARELRARSSIFRDGRIFHRLRYRVSAGDPAPLRFQLPPATQVLAAFEDGHLLRAGQRGNEAAVVLRATDNGQWADLDLLLLQTQPPLGQWSVVSAALPTAPMELQSVRWEVGPPPEHELRWVQSTLQPAQSGDRGAAVGEGTGGGADGQASLGPQAAVLERTGVTRTEALVVQATVASRGLIRGLELLVFLLAVVLPVGAAIRGSPPRAVVAALAPATIMSFLVGPVLSSPWRPLVAGAILAGAIAALRHLAARRSA